VKTAKQPPGNTPHAPKMDDFEVILIPHSLRFLSFHLPGKFTNCRHREHWKRSSVPIQSTIG
jgi:hypothetical protein